MSERLINTAFTVLPYMVVGTIHASAFMHSKILRHRPIELLSTLSLGAFIAFTIAQDILNPVSDAPGPRFGGLLAGVAGYLSGKALLETHLINAFIWGRPAIIDAAIPLFQQAHGWINHNFIGNA